MDKDEVDDRTVSAGALRARRILKCLLICEKNFRWYWYRQRSTLNGRQHKHRLPQKRQRQQMIYLILSADVDTGLETRTNMHFRECNTVPPVGDTSTVHRYGRGATS
eukprot:5414905-Pleurochrysis_carterae.AAC.1